MIHLAEVIGKYGRVVELVDSLDSGSSVHCGRAGSSPASPTKSTHGGFVMSAFFLQKNKKALNDPQKMLPEQSGNFDISTLPGVHHPFVSPPGDKGGVPLRGPPP